MKPALLASEPEGGVGRRRHDHIAAIADHVEERTQKLSEVIYERFAAEIPEYTMAGILQSADEVKHSISSLAHLFVCVVREQRRLCPAELAGLAALGSERADQGVPLDSLLRALRIAMKVGWQDTTTWIRGSAEGPAMLEAVSDVAFQLLEFVDDASQCLAGSYLRRRDQVMSERDRRRRDLLNDVLSGTGDTTPELRSRAVEVGFDISAPHGLVALAAPSQSTPASVRSAASLDRAIPSAFHLEVFDSGTRSQVFIVRTYQPEGWERALEVAGVLAADLGLVGLFSPPGSGAARLHAEYERIRKLLPWARTVLAAGSVKSVADVAVYGLLGASSPTDRAAFIDQTLGPILRLPVNQRDPLLETMRALFENGGSPSAAARVLNVHPKTVQYRACRVADLTGLSWRKPPERLRLDLALHLIWITAGTARH